MLKTPVVENGTVIDPAGATQVAGLEGPMVVMDCAMSCPPLINSPHTVNQINW